MSRHAQVLAPAVRAYRGTITRPERWATWTPRPGDILVCTPPKCGTTWTQTILSMLVQGTPELPAPIPVLSPWVDADLGVSGQEVAAALDAQTGRRVVKTHTPADGFPVWQDVTVVAVYRHPLDVFFSLRKHVANRVDAPLDHPMLSRVSTSLARFCNGVFDIDDFDRDTLATFTTHFRETAGSGRLPDVKVLHYADMMRDGRETVERLAQAIGASTSAALLDKIAQATDFGEMRKNAGNYVPVAGTGYWKSDAGFFDSATSHKWLGHVSEQEFAHYQERFRQLVPKDSDRTWLENGGR